MCNVINRFPNDMLSYINQYGLHFNKSLCEFAVNLMRKKDAGGNMIKIAAMNRDQVSELLRENNVQLGENRVIWDAVYVANMCQADYLGGAVPDKQHLALFVKQTLNDPDAEEGHVFNRWYSEMCLNGMFQYIDWERMI